MRIEINVEPGADTLLVPRRRQHLPENGSWPCAGMGPPQSDHVPVSYPAHQDPLTTMPQTLEAPRTNPDAKSALAVAPEEAVPRPMSLDLNDEFLRALSLLEDGKNVFITGKAGTGKSTLLRLFLSSTQKAIAVAAPTGVAALNVDGVTIHRLLSFPASVTTAFVRSKEYFPRKYIHLIRTLEVLVIDEISMVRADLLDCVNEALQRFGPRRGVPFGGVQLVLVGDPYQLPPVVTEREEEYFRTRYATPFFFSADSFRNFPIELIELDKVYRQDDPRFVALLNSIRTGDADDDVTAELNERYDPQFAPPQDEFWVTLTTTNAHAESVNDARLAAIAAPLLRSVATRQGDLEGFDPSAPDELTYKVGAQVMLLNNDGLDRWVNGSLGAIDSVDSFDDTVSVNIVLQDGPTVCVRPHTWEVKRPSVNSGVLGYETVGSYTQLPFKLAWAITIHKSQGKTLERAIIDLYRGTFAEGQLYVALSRCRSLSGMVLRTPVKPHHVKVEREVTRFLSRSTEASEKCSDRAYLGVLATGFGAYDRILEIAAIIERSGHIAAEISTLVNPCRDVGDAVGGYGFSASDLSLAPTLAEAWPTVARQLSGCSMIGCSLATVQTMIERELKADGIVTNLGLGIDLLELARAGGVDPEGANEGSALDRARAAAALFSNIHVDGLVVTPYRPGPETLGAGALQARTTPTLHLSEEVEPQLAYADLAAIAVSNGQDTFAWHLWLESNALERGLSKPEVRALHDDALRRLIQRSDRDGTASNSERGRIDEIARLLGLPHPSWEADLPCSEIGMTLTPGTRVCFTGSARGLAGEVVERSELEALADRLGLVAVDSVTKKSCDVLVAADASSMSGKAKKARDWGKPVYDACQFLEWANSAETS